MRSIFPRRRGSFATEGFLPLPQRVKKILLREKFFGSNTRGVPKLFQPSGPLSVHKTLPERLERLGFFDDERKPGALRNRKPIVNPVAIRTLLIEHMADPHERFSAEAFSRKYGIPTLTVRALARDERIGKLVKKRIRELIGHGESLGKVYQALFTKARQGSVKHAKLLLEISGEYIPNMKITPDLSSVEARFRELESQRNKSIRVLRSGTHD